MESIQRDQLGLNSNPNYMDLLRAYARLHFYARAAYAGGGDLNKLAYECGWTSSMVASAFNVGHLEIEAVMAKLYIGEYKHTPGPIL